MELLHPQLMKLDLFSAVPQVEIPVFLAEGRHDRVVPAPIAAEYFNQLKAPSKDLTWFENSAHMPDIEERDKFHQLLLREVLPLAK
jgi:pimeloyl-ACP methyl ester carboxylesterase